VQPEPPVVTSQPESHAQALEAMVQPPEEKSVVGPILHASVALTDVRCPAGTYRRDSNFSCTYPRQILFRRRALRSRVPRSRRTPSRLRLAPLAVPPRNRQRVIHHRARFAHFSFCLV
jgi:hypothetical protein